MTNLDIITFHKCVSKVEEVYKEQDDTIKIVIIDNVSIEFHLDNFLDVAIDSVMVDNVNKKSLAEQLQDYFDEYCNNN